MTGGSLRDERRHHVADGGRELEAVAREARGHVVALGATPALHRPAALRTIGAWISPAAVRTPRTRSPSTSRPRTAVSSRTRAPAARAARAKPWAVSTGLQ